MNAIELFAGAGGLGMGLSRAGFAPELVLEWDADCCDTLLENQRRRVSPLVQWPIFKGDVRLEDFRRFEDKVDLVSGGPPCQPFSLGGRHRASNDTRDMFPQAVRAVREVRPKAFVFENVKGLKRASFTNYFQYITLQLSHPNLVKRADEAWEEHLKRLERFESGGGTRDLNYRVLTELLNAADYGIPQRRERVFFVGIRADIKADWCFPSPTHADAALAHAQNGGDYWDQYKVPSKLRRAARSASRERPLLKPWRTVRDAISDLPDPERKPFESSILLNHKLQKGARAYPGHTGSPLDEPAKTLKAGVHGVPGGENMLLKPDGSVRYFTVRESARLQTFPDHFHFQSSWTESMRQLGNAVPVDLACCIGNSLREKLEALP